MNAFKNMGVPVLECTGHRLNSMVSWGVGISGSIQAGGGGTNKNRRLNALIARATAMVGRFSHSPVNNDALKEIQREVSDLTQELDLVRRNDTRYGDAACVGR